MNATGIARSRGKQVNYDKVKSPVKCLYSLVGERTNCMTALLVSRRNQFQQRDDSIVAGMTNGDCSPFEQVIAYLGFVGQFWPWRSGRHCDTARLIGPVVSGAVGAEICALCIGCL